MITDVGYCTRKEGALMGQRLTTEEPGRIAPHMPPELHPTIAPEVQAAASLRASKRSHRIMAWIAIIAVFMGAGGIALVQIFLG